jgi:hypothetical protein
MPVVARGVHFLVRDHSHHRLDLDDLPLVSIPSEGGTRSPQAGP